MWFWFPFILNKSKTGFSLSVGHISPVLWENVKIMFASIIDVLRRFINSGKDSGILFVKQQKNMELIEVAIIRKLNMFYKCVIAELPGEPLSFRNVYISESGISKLFWCLGRWWRLQNNTYWWQCEISASGKPIRVSLNSYKNFPCKSIIGLTLYNSTISAKSPVFEQSFEGVLWSPELHSGRGFLFLSCAGHPLTLTDSSEHLAVLHTFQAKAPAEFAPTRQRITRSYFAW